VEVGFGEMFMLAVLALLIFGPERLPGIARTVGQTVGRVRREAMSTFEALRDETELAELREFSSELQRERDELTSLSRVDGDDDARTSTTRARPARPPRYDPHST